MAHATKKRSAGSSDRKSDWKSRNDRGPHTATLPSGVTVQFIIPNETQLIRSDRLPERLSEIAILASAYPGGGDGLMEDIAVRTVHVDDDQREAANAKLKETVKQALELRDWLVAEMLIDPEVTAEEVAAGDFPDQDIEMLVEFAERRRNTDAEGRQLPIVVLEDFARFRDVNGSEPGDGSRRGDGQDVPAADAGADGDQV